MLEDCFYDKVKLIHKLSCIAWFIEKHAKQNAQKGGDNECTAAMKELSSDLEKHLAKLKSMLCK